MSSPSFIKNLMKDGFVYGMTRYIGVVAAIFLTPLYTRMIPRFDYGIMDIFNVWIGFFTLLIPVGLIQALPRLWMDSRNDELALKNILGNFNSLILIFTLTFLVVSLSLKFLFESLIIQSTGFSHIYYLSICIAVLQVIYTQQLAILRQLFYRRLYIAISLLNLAIITLFGFTLVYYYEMGIRGFFLASVFAFSVTVIFSLYVNRRYFVLRFDKPLLSSMLRYSSPLLYVAIFFSLSDITDRFIINHFMTTSDVGLYSVGARIASIPLFFTTAFSTAWFPRIFSIKDPGERNKEILNTHRLALLFFGSIFLSVVLFRTELIRFFAPSYTDAFSLILLLSLAYVINGMGPVYAVGIHLEKTTAVLLKGALISVLANAVLSIILLRYYGINGVAAGTLLGAFLWTWLRFRYGQKKLKLSFSFSNLYWLLPVSAAIIWLSIILEPTILNFAIKMVCLIPIVYILFHQISKSMKTNAETV